VLVVGVIVMFVVVICAHGALTRSGLVDGQAPASDPRLGLMDRCATNASFRAAATAPRLPEFR
jgi:hypothetical protein